MLVSVGLSAEEKEVKEDKRAMCIDEPIEISQVEERMKIQFTRMDRNEDGKLDKKELAKRHLLGRKSDKSRGHDRGAAGDESRRHMRKQMGKWPAHVLCWLDTDGSGALSPEEFTAPRIALLRRMDTDGDGVVTPEEKRDARREGNEN